MNLQALTVYEDIKTQDSYMHLEEAAPRAVKEH